VAHQPNLMHLTLCSKRLHSR